MKKELYRRLKKISERFKKDYRAEKVILFGSYSSGEEREDSDIDLLIIAPTKERFFERMATARRLIRDLRKGLPVAPIVLTRKEVEKKKMEGNQFVDEILSTGIDL